MIPSTACPAEATERHDARISDGIRRFRLSCMNGTNRPCAILKPTNASMPMNALGAFARATSATTPTRTIENNVRRSVPPR